VYSTAVICAEYYPHALLPEEHDASYLSSVQTSENSSSARHEGAYKSTAKRQYKGRSPKLETLALLIMGIVAASGRGLVEWAASPYTGAGMAEPGPEGTPNPYARDDWPQLSGRLAP